MSKRTMKKIVPDMEKAVAALYIRVSTDAQYEEGYSAEAQQERLTAYVKALGIKRFEYYIDGGFSGSNLERPEMRRLIEDAKNSKVTHVIVYKLDRISRSQKDTLYLIEDVFLTHNVAFISINESFDTSSAFGRAVVGILSVFAQLERENIFERTRMGMQKRVESGLWMGGGRVPYGYDYDRERGILVPNKDAEKVRQVYDLYLQGYAMQKIADMLGLKYDRLAQQILTRKSNAGYITYNGAEYKGQHEPIVSEETYEKAMIMLRERSAKRFISTTSHLLTGLVYCGKCGAKMRYQKWGKNGCRFVCYSQQRSKDYLVRDPDCDNGRAWCDEVEEAVVGAIFDLSAKIENGDEETKPISALEILQGQYNDAAAKIKRLYNLYADSEDSILLETIEENKAELDKISRKIQLEDEKAIFTKTARIARDSIKSIADLWDYMSIAERQNTVRAVVDRITLTDDNIDIKFIF